MTLPHFVPQPLRRMTPRQRYEANLAVLRVCKDVADRQTTESQREVLALYTGWGDTEVRKHAFVHDGAITPHFAVVAAELGLSEAALDAMRRSVLNAHYTDVGVVRAAWGILRHLGFNELRAPRVLEPSAGIGHFVGCAPVYDSDLTEDRVVAVELDPASAAVCRALYPRADVRQDAFERVAPGLPASFDAVVGNVPFGDYRVTEPSGEGGGSDLSPVCSGTIHDYFVCRSVSLLRPGGVAVLITSKGTLDKRRPAVRRWLAERADLVGAFRLPGDAFEECAGTEVTTDLLVLQRLRRDRAFGEDDAPEWVGTQGITFPGKHGHPVEDEVNAYYLSHPDHVLGEWCQNKLVWRPDAGVRRRAGDDRPVGQMIAELTGRLPAGILRDAPKSAARSANQGPIAPPVAPQFTTRQEIALGAVLRAARRVAQEGG